MYPMCLLDTRGKMSERLTHNRLLSIVERSNGLSKHQHGFRLVHYTVNAIIMVVNLAKTRRVLCNVMYNGLLVLPGPRRNYDCQLCGICKNLTAAGTLSEVASSQSVAIYCASHGRREKSR